MDRQKFHLGSRWMNFSYRDLQSKLVFSTFAKCTGVYALHPLMPCLSKSETLHWRILLMVWFDLSWLREELAKFNVFVANRIVTVQQQAKDIDWKYVNRIGSPNLTVENVQYKSTKSYIKEKRRNLQAAFLHCGSWFCDFA